VTCAKWLGHVAHPGFEAFLEAHRVDHFTAYITALKRMCDDFVPAVLQHVLELDGALRA
jgi:hypothetical protein